MPYQTTWESPNSISTRFSGIVTFEETVTATNAFYSDLRSDEVNQSFWDFSAIDGFEVSTENVLEMAGTDCVAGRYLKPMKSAFIVRDPALAALTEQYIAYMRELGSPWENRLFACMDDARRWMAEGH